MKTEDIICHGGIVSAAQASSAEDTLVAYSSTSSALLGERVMVRLLPEQLIEAEKLTQEFFGLEPGTVTEVGAVMNRAVGFPAWPILHDPANAIHALNLVGDLEWARRMAQSSPGKVADRFQKLNTDLGNAAPHFLPTLFEELARIFDDVGNTRYASRFFTKAREVERTHGLDIDDERHRSAFMEFSRRGAVSAKELTLEAAACLSRSQDPVQAYRYFLAVNLAHITGGGAPYSLLMRDLNKLGKAAGMKPADVAEELIRTIGGSAGMRRAQAGFFKAIVKALKPTVEDNPELVQGLFKEKSSAMTLDEWFQVAHLSGFLTTLGDNPDLIAQWVTNSLAGTRDNQETSEEFVNFIRANAAAFRGRTMRVPFASTPLEVLDALEEKGVIWEFTDPDTKAGHLNVLLREITGNRYSGNNNALGHNSAPRLDYVFKNRQLCDRFLDYWDDDEYFFEAFAVKFAQAGYPDLVEAAARRNLDALGDGEKLLPGLKKLSAICSKLRKMSLSAELLETFRAAIDLKAEEILAANLRAGLITELTWPELEQHVDSWRSTIKPGVDFKPKVQLLESFPGVVAVWGKHIVAVEGEHTLYNHTHERSIGAVDVAAYVGHTPDIIACDSERERVFWLSGTAVTLKPSDYWWQRLEITSSAPWGDGRLFPGGMVYPGASIMHNVSGSVFSNSDGQSWCVDEAGCRVVDPRTGDKLGHGRPQELLDLFAHAGENARLELGQSTMLALPSGTTVTDADSVVGLVDGHLLCASGVETNHELGYVAVDGDGEVYRSGVAISGVIRCGDARWLRSTDGELHLPGHSTATGQLEPTRDNRGEKHWLHGLPWSAWVNLRVRSAEATTRLREATAESAATILEALVIETGAGNRAKAKRSNSQHVGPYNAIDKNCLPDAAAMKAAQEFLGLVETNTHGDLCVSVVQLALEVAKVHKRLRRLGKELTLLIARAQATKAQEAADSTPAQVKPLITNSVAAQEVTQLAKIAQQQPTARGKKWYWAQLIGVDKAYAMAMLGPLAAAADKLELAAMFRTMAEHKIGAPAWTQAFVDWSKLARIHGKAQLGMRIPLSEASDAPDVPQAIVLKQKGKSMRILVNGTLPETTFGVELTGAPKLGEHYGIATGMPRDKLIDSAERLEASTQVVDLDAAAVEAYRDEILPFAQVLAERSFLTLKAAIVLCVGGYHPNRQASFTESSQLQVRYTDKEKAQIVAVRRWLKISAAAHNSACQQLATIDLGVVELLLAAVFDRNLDAVRSIAESLPGTVVPLDDSTLEKLVGWGKQYQENPFQVVLRAANPLQRGFRLKHQVGYGRITGALLYWATHAALDDPLRAFYADQLETVKLLTNADFSLEWPTELPLQGIISEQDHNGYYYQSTSYPGDAVRALKSGLFDAVIAGLRRAPQAGGCVFDPRVSAPETVAAVAQKLGLSELGATYFLQILCLVECTDVNVKQWNGWKKKDLDSARAELIAHELVIQAKRARAGRSVFLPGTWWSASNPHPALEAWKAAYYAVRFDGKAFSVVPWCPPIMLVDELFATAWQRYDGGDVPGFEKLSTTKYKKRGS